MHDRLEWICLWPDVTIQHRSNMKYILLVLLLFCCCKGPRRNPERPPKFKKGDLVVDRLKTSDTLMIKDFHYSYGDSTYYHIVERRGFGKKEFPEFQLKLVE